MTKRLNTLSLAPRGTTTQSVGSSQEELRSLGKLTLPRSTNRRLKIHAYSAQVSECFGPSIQSTVVAIGDNFNECLPIGSVCILGTG